jgi:hypothetical protein
MAFKMKPSSFRKTDGDSYGTILENYEAARDAIKNKKFPKGSLDKKTGKYTIPFYNKEGKVETTTFRFN